MTWDLLGKISPAIPLLNQAAMLAEDQFKLKRSRKHSYPDGKSEVERLSSTFVSNEVFLNKPGRAKTKITKKYRPYDCFARGDEVFQDTPYLDKWREKRLMWHKSYSTKNDFSNPVEDGEDSDNSDSGSDSCTLGDSDSIGEISLTHLELDPSEGSDDESTPDDSNYALEPTHKNVSRIDNVVHMDIDNTT